MAPRSPDTEPFRLTLRSDPVTIKQSLVGPLILSSPTGDGPSRDSTLDTDHLFSIRNLTTYFVLTALLFSNVAGWVHVGCVSDSHQANAAQENGGHRCSCHHDHCNSGPSPADRETLPIDEHDSGSCSICQSFYASRNAVVARDVSITWTSVLVARLRVVSSSLHLEQTRLSGLSVRGPPNA
ncbi:hypothetical protein NHH03_15180 [Stieleria sp. TO1_6]|uniref:hypothetical protein n=1 Tax=Stieleria tagensis TaxID=2956795 RepID=UPI00209B44CB|nr:hypothetical protein [Stieleria tagensis]MCO8123089.1 hypothetical protein [Stieleria tagensis]